MTAITFNVAQMLREPIGARRSHTFEEPQLPLDTTLVLRMVTGDVRFTRSASGVVAAAHARGVVEVQCVRSLELFDYPLELQFVEEFHSVVDVLTSVRLPAPTEEDPLLLTEAHLADIGAVIREYALLELPLNPVSPAYADQPVHYSVQTEGESDNEDDAVDERLQALKALKDRPQSS